jgi:hypothetical protein
MVLRQKLSWALVQIFNSGLSTWQPESVGGWRERVTNRHPKEKLGEENGENEAIPGILVNIDDCCRRRRRRRWAEEESRVNGGKKEGENGIGMILTPFQMSQSMLSILSPPITSPCRSDISNSLPRFVTDIIFTVYFPFNVSRTPR